MKKIIVTLLVLGFVGGWAVAQQRDVDPSATTGYAGKKKAEATFKLLTPNKSAREPVRIGGPDTRPWTMIVGWHPGESAFPDPKTAEGGLRLLSVDRMPSRLTDITVTIAR